MTYHNQLQFPNGITRLVLIDSVPKRTSVSTNHNESETSTKIYIEKKKCCQPRGSIFTCEDKALLEYVKEEPQVRKDAYGNPIVKGGKSHRVSFRDRISSKRIAEQIIIYVEKENQEECRCSCGIF